LDSSQKDARRSKPWFNTPNAHARTMAPQTTPFRVQAFNFVLDVANGRHALSKLIPIVLWLMDGGLTSIVIWKVPCMLRSP
jgi:alpha-1,3-mannosyltransferase